MEKYPAFEKILLLSFVLFLPSLGAGEAARETKTGENPINAVARELKMSPERQAAVAERIYEFMWKDYVESSVKSEKDNAIRLRAAVRAWVEETAKKDAPRLGIAEFDHLLQLKAEDARAKALVASLKAWSGNSDPAEGFIFSGSYLAATKTAHWINAFLTEAIAQTQKILRAAPRAMELPAAYDPSQADH